MSFLKKYYFYIIPILLLPVRTFAHVGYILSEHEISKGKGINGDYLLSVLMDSTNQFLIFATVGSVFLVYLYVDQHKVIRSYISLCQKRARTYASLVPWMLRLSVGIALIGAGSSYVLISPALEPLAAFATLQILTGFLLLSGFLLSPAALIAILLFLIAFLFDTYMLGSLDFFAAAIAISIYADPRPGIDDIFGIPFTSPFSGYNKWVPFILRLGVGGSMVYLALYEKLFNPLVSAEVVVRYGLTDVIPVSPAMWVFSAGILEFTLGLLLIVGFHTRLMAAIAFVVLSFSFFYFGEQVYSHITLFGVFSALFVLGGGMISMDMAGIPKRLSRRIQQALH